MTYWKAQKEQHLRQLAHLFEGDPGGGKFNGQAQPFVLQAPEKNLFAPIRDEALLYFNGHLPGADGRLRFWRSGGERVVAGHVCSLPTGHVLSSQVACLNHLFPLSRDGKAATLLLQGLRPDMVEALPVGIHARDMFVEFEVTGGGSYLNEEQRGRSLTRGGQCHICGCGHERTGHPGEHPAVPHRMKIYGKLSFQAREEARQQEG